MVADETRLRDLRDRLDVFRGSALGRSRRALISLGFTARLFGSTRVDEIFDPLEHAERLCDTMKAYCAVIPATRAELEDFICSTAPSRSVIRFVRIPAVAAGA